MYWVLAKEVLSYLILCTSHDSSKQIEIQTGTQTFVCLSMCVCVCVLTDMYICTKKEKRVITFLIDKQANNQKPMLLVVL